MTRIPTCPLRSVSQVLVRIAPDGHTVVTPAPESSSAAIHRDYGINTAGHVVLVNGAVPEPGRREAEEFPGTGPAPSSDPELLERVLRERMPDAVGATDEELAALEARLGIPLPAELRAVLSVTGARYGDYGPYGQDDRYDRYDRDTEALGGLELFGIDEIERASVADVRKGMPFDMLAKVAVVTRDDSAVQGLLGSSKWIVADSLTDLVLGRTHPHPDADPGEEPPVVVTVNGREHWTVEEAATDQLEVLRLIHGATASDLGPLAGLPRLRTLEAEPGPIADPLAIARLEHLEYLLVGLDEWNALLAADAVPDSLLAAGISGYDLDRAEVDAVYDGLIGSRGGRGLSTVAIAGDLGRRYGNVEWISGFDPAQLVE